MKRTKPSSLVAYLTPSSLPGWCKRRFASCGTAIASDPIQLAWMVKQIGRLHIQLTRILFTIQASWMGPLRCLFTALTSTPSRSPSAQGGWGRKSCAGPEIDQFAIRNSQARRRGAVLIIALVCLALATVIGGALLRWALMEHKLLRTQEQASQARWLAEAGVERAAAQLGASAEYQGETWEVSAADLPAGEPARIHLHVAPIDGQPRRRSVDVEVEYPFESKSPIRIQKQIIYILPSGEGS
jgi:hypothetical protein